MMESFIKVDDDLIFLRHNLVKSNRTTLLFVHGLGESGLCFQEVFEDKRFNSFNILVPDMVGYGRSSASAKGDYTFDAQIKRLRNIVQQYPIGELIVIGHSLGGDLTTLFCASDSEHIIKKYINIEGTITQFDIFISNQAVETAERGEFEHWFKETFMNSQVYDDWGSRSPACRRYYASLCFCRPEAFLANAQELYKRNTSLGLIYQSEIGQVYCSLSIPKVYCYGTESLSPKTSRFLQEMGLESQAFDGAAHWVMIDRKDEFYSFLYDFISA